MREQEPEHYSWNLGRPDNARGTEVIVNPYATRISAPESSRPVTIDFRGDTDLSQEYNGNVNPYKRSFSAGIDGKEYLLPTQDPAGRDISEDEAIAAFLQNGKHLGRFTNTSEAEMFSRSKR